MLIGLTLALVLLGAAQLYLLVRIYTKLEGHAPDAKPERERERTRRDLIDEGVESILTFNVKGKTGFESRDEE